MGKIIGKEGRTAKAIRLLRIVGAKDNERVNLKIMSQKVTVQRSSENEQLFKKTRRKNQATDPTPAENQMKTLIQYRRKEKLEIV